MTPWMHVLISDFTGKNAHQDSNIPVNTAGHIRKQIFIHCQEHLHQELITKKRRSGDGAVPLHTVLGSTRPSFRSGVCSPDSGGTHIFAYNPWPRDPINFCTSSSSHSNECRTLDVQPWKKALKVPSVHLMRDQVPSHLNKFPNMFLKCYSEAFLLWFC